MPRLSPKKKVVGILILFAVCLFISLPQTPPFFGRKFDLILGLDLAGGSHLIFDADTSQLPQSEVKNAMESVKTVIEKRVNLFGVSEPNVITSSFEGKNRIIVDLPGIKNTKQATDLIGKTAQLVFAEVANGEKEEGLTPTELTGTDLINSTVVFDSTSGKPQVSLKFSQAGADKFANLTQKNVGKPLAIVLDNEVISAPVVQEKITGGGAIISGTFSLEEAKKMVIQLNAGALAVPIRLIEEQTIGASLGADSVAKSIRAGIVGLVMVLIFMILAYGRLGLIADLGLIIFGVLTLTVYKFIPVVLTLPGIAGFLLSVGMAVDSNILVFERFNEEKIRRNTSDALEIAFGRAWDSIRDANVATLVTSFVLANPFDWPFLNTSGPVRGFAITLALGIAISLFTGIVVSRNLLRVFVGERFNKN